MQTWAKPASVRDSTRLNDLNDWRDAQRCFYGMTGISRVSKEIFETIRAVGPSDYPVLISGESGTGKELVAAALHDESRRKSGPFVPVNCGALPENILESELFGHVRGAFSGAIRDRKGRFELAHKGTIFLDEVGELSPRMQVSLLRVLQHSAFERVGGETSIAVDNRIIAATNRDLRAMVETGAFREDLFYRLCVIPLDLPPLRERREDIPYIMASVLEKVQTETGKEMRFVSDDAMYLLKHYPWPGNIRELINSLQFASIRCPGDVVLADHLPQEIQKSHGSPKASPRYGSPTGPIFASVDPPGKRRHRKLTPETVQQALVQSEGNKLRAATLLGVGRATLYRFLHETPIDSDPPIQKWRV
jgi:sigma-54 dependent transcriptional regulator, acetoin dehydrogenase operon transcriptional activator AcoR